MRKFIASLGILFCAAINAQTTTVFYTASNAVISNPERGFYKYSSAHTGTYNGLDQAFITTFRTNNNITLLLREFRLRDYIDSPISDTYLTNMQSDFDKIRNAGMKCIIRFVYSDDDGLDVLDATKAQMLSHIQQLTPLLQANGDVIATMQAGFIGAWGEWYSTSQAEFGGYGYNQTDLTPANIQHRKDILNAILAALPANRSVQVRYPAFKMSAYSANPVTRGMVVAGSPLARIGHHNDCFLATPNDYGTYDNISLEQPFVIEETKFVPMGGETCQENSPRSDCPSALLEMSKLHWSFLNLDWYPDVIDNFQTDNCFADIQRNLGYRFQLTSATFPQTVALGNQLHVVIDVKNVGNAAPFNERKAYLVLKNVATNEIIPIRLASDPRTWLGPNLISINEYLTLPANFRTGTYKLYLNLPDSAPTLAGRPEYAIRFANDNVWESITGFNSLNYTLNVTAALATGDFSKFDMSVYPIPAKNELTVELKNTQEYNVAVFNSVGQKINAENQSTQTDKIVFNTASWSDGIYFIEFTKGTARDIRKIMVKH